MFWLFRADLHFITWHKLKPKCIYFTQLQTGPMLSLGLTQWHNATNFGIPEFGSLKFSEFPNSQNQSIMGETELLTGKPSLPMSPGLVRWSSLKASRKVRKAWAVARTSKEEKSHFYLLRLANYGYKTGKQTLSAKATGPTCHEDQSELQLKWLN